MRYIITGYGRESTPSLMEETQPLQSLEESHTLYRVLRVQVSLLLENQPVVVRQELLS